MRLERIYNEFFNCYEDEYYIDLAKDEVLMIPVLVEVMIDGSFSNANRALVILERISCIYPDLIYPYFDYIASALDNTNSFIAWNTWKILSNLTADDIKDKWNTVSERFYSALESEQITEFSIACACAENVIVNKPLEAEKILGIVAGIEKREFYISGEKSESSSIVAKEKVQQLLDNIINRE